MRNLLKSWTRTGKIASLCLALLLASGILTFGQHLELQWHIKSFVLD